LPQKVSTTVFILFGLQSSFYLQQSLLHLGPKFQALVKTVPNPFRRGGPEEIPNVFVVCSGPKTPDKVDLANKVVVTWQLDFKKKRPSADSECPYYSPASTNGQLRIFFAALKSQYGWEIGMEDLSNFKGSLTATLKDLYNEREVKYVSYLWHSNWSISSVMVVIVLPSCLFFIQGSIGYGKKNPNTKLSESDQDKIRLDAFDEDILEEHCMKCMVGFGSKFGFRGNDEHTKLTRDKIYTGYFPAGHRFEGMQFWGILGMTDKTSNNNKLKPINQNTKHCTSFIIMPLYFETHVGVQPPGSLL